MEPTERVDITGEGRYFIKMRQSEAAAFRAMSAEEQTAYRAARGWPQPRPGAKAMAAPPEDKEMPAPQNKARRGRPRKGE